MIKVVRNFNLVQLNTFRLKCFAKYFSQIDHLDELKELLNHLPDEAPFILGGGSNILLTQDLPFLVIHNRIKGIDIVKQTDTEVYLRVGAGEVWHDFVMYCVKNEYGGVENLSLIPGRAGAAPIQNIGAYGVELKDTFYELEALHLKEQYIRKFSAQECDFGYRESVFKHALKNQFAIINITLRLSKKPGFNLSYGAIRRQLEQMGIENVTIKAVSDAVINIRKSKLPDPADLGNAGSFFKNPVIDKDVFTEIQKTYPDIPHYSVSERIKIPAAWLIEQSGLKGYRSGSTGCYEKQPLVIVNYGDATGKEIYDFSQEIIGKVKSKFSIALQREVNVF